MINCTWIGLERPVVCLAKVSPDVGCRDEQTVSTMIRTVITHTDIHPSRFMYLEWPGTKSHSTLISRRIILHVHESLEIEHHLCCLECRDTIHNLVPSPSHMVRSGYEARDTNKQLTLHTYFSSRT